MAPRNGESGFRMLAIWLRRFGRSLTQCIDREERQAEKDCGGKGKGSFGEGGRMVRV